jgi:hypothetical protein
MIPKSRHKNFTRQWSGRKISRVAYWYAAGYTSREIATMLRDGTTAESVRHQIHRWGVAPAGNGKDRPIPARIPHNQLRRARLAARKRGMELGDLLAAILKAAIEEEGVVDLLLTGDMA